MFKPSSETKRITAEQWNKSLTPKQRANIDALIKQSETGFRRFAAPVSTPAVFPELPQHPLEQFLPKHVNQEGLPKGTDPIVRVSESYLEDGRHVVNEWRGHVCGGGRNA